MRGSAVRPAGLAAALLAAIGLSAPPAAGSGGAAVLRVEAGGPYASIGAAVSAAAPGDTVVVPAGVHRERVTIDRPIALVGEAGAVIDAGGTGTVVRIAAPDVVLAGLVLRGSGRSLESDDSGVLVTAPRAVVRDNVLEAVLHGVYVLGAGEATVSGNTIRGGRAASLSTRGDGIRIWNAGRTTVVANEVLDVRDGIFLQAADDSRIERNVVRRSRYGLHYMYAAQNVFEGNLFEHNQVGASIMMSRRIRLARNTFAYNAGYVGYGVLLQDAEEVEVSGNRILGNATGLFMDQAVRSRVVGNLIAANQIGINLYPSSEANVFARNVFAANLADVHAGRGGVGNAFAGEAGGNYWGGAGVYDFDGDGVGDVPHRTGSLFAHFAESRPQLRLFLFSPAARALDAAERALPVVRVPEAVDPRPLAHPPAAAQGAPPPGDGGGGGGLARLGALLALAGAAGLHAAGRRAAPAGACGRGGP